VNLCQMGMEKVLSELSGGLQNMGVEPLPGKNVSAKSPNPKKISDITRLSQPLPLKSQAIEF
jgi:hypothetical protein